MRGKPEGFKIMHGDQYADGAACYTYRFTNGFGGGSLTTRLCTTLATRSFWQATLLRSRSTALGVSRRGM